jgi:lysozyme
MRLDDNGYNALHEREGLKLKPYLDTQGIPTIAMGNTYYLDGKKVTMKDKVLTMREAYKLGSVTSDNFAKQVNALLTKEVTQNQFNALVSLAYNIGINGFAKSTVLRRVNANPNDPTIKSAFMMWTKNKELIGRRKSEVEQYFRKQL